jgi:hypothetical protein
VAQWAAKAVAASAVATPRLRALLGEGGKVRALLGDCCPALASASADELLARLRMEVEHSELTHNFAHYNAPSRWENDVDLLTLANASYFYNLNELGFLGLSNGKGAGIPVGAETQIMGFPPFTGAGGQPRNFDEASQRPVYGLLNLLSIDGAMPFFGDVGVVFRNSWVRNATLYFPTDTGNWAAFNSSKHAAHHCTFPVSLNQSAWASRVPGISGHLDHILLAFEQTYSSANRCPESAFASPLATILRRLFGTGGAARQRLSKDETFLFIESDVAASPHFPAAVSHVVAAWRLMGTVWGERLRDLCTKHGWPLMWALGANSADHGNSSLAVVVPSQRLLDARVCLAPSVQFRANMTARCSSSDRAVEALWQRASAVNLTARTPSMLQGWWDTLLQATDSAAQGLLVEGPLRPGQCAASDCVGLVVACAARGQCCACAHPRSSIKV